MNRKEVLLRVLVEMESERIALFARLDQLPEAKLSLQPAAGSWSVTQVIMHLVIAEEGGLAYLRKKLSFAKHKPVGTFSVLRLMLLKAAMASPFKFKAPAIVAVVPNLGYTEAKERWAAVRKAMHDVYSSLPDEHVGHDLYKHPLAGKLDLVQGTRFIHAHCKRHMDQIDRILKRIG